VAESTVEVGRAGELTRADPPVRSAHQALEAELATQVEAVLERLGEQERLAAEALDSMRVYSWPSWSMDTGLTAVQERFVEAWPPERHLDASRAERRVLQELRSWTRVHTDDDSLRLALSIVTMLRLR
jgi:hypothetical protein